MKRAVGMRCFHNKVRGVSRRRVVLSLVLLGLVLWVLFQVQNGKVAYFEVETSSMSPTILPGDRLISAPPSRGYQRDDLVVFKAPDNASVLVVKRLLAMYPDEVQVRDGSLYINGQLDGYESFGQPSDDLPDRVWRLEPGQFFVAGDNRWVSLDSRSYGPLTMAQLRGIILYRTRPAARRGSMR